MTRREIAELICKTLSLMIFAYAAFFLIAALILLCSTLFLSAVQSWTDWSDVQAVFLILIPALTPTIVATLYWKKSATIARFMVSDDEESVTTASLTVTDVMTVVFATCGIFFLSSGVKELVTIVVFMDQYSSDASEIWRSPRSWSGLIDLGFGLWLMLGSHGIAAAIRALRNAGRYDLEEDSKTDGD